MWEDPSLCSSEFKGDFARGVLGNTTTAGYPVGRGQGQGLRRVDYYPVSHPQARKPLPRGRSHGSTVGGLDRRHLLKPATVTGHVLDCSVRYPYSPVPGSVIS